MNEANLFQRAGEAKHSLLAVIAMLYTALQAAYFGKYEIAVSIFHKAESLGGDALGISDAGAPTYYWAVVQWNSERCRSTGQRQQYLRKEHKFTKLPEQMKAAGSPNIAPYLAYLHAATAARKRSVGGDILRASYNDGIACSVTWYIWRVY
jgi:hypothetical protein